MTQYFEGPDGKRIPVADDATPEDMKKIYAHIYPEHTEAQRATKEGFLGQMGVPLDMAGALDQFGQGVLHGATELPGLPADLSVFLGNTISRQFGGPQSTDTGPLGSAAIRGSLGPQGLGLIPDIKPTSIGGRYAKRIGEFVGGGGAAGSGGGRGLMAAVGGGVGSQTGDELFRGSDWAPIIGGLLGVWGGGRAANYFGAEPLPVRVDPKPSLADFEKIIQEDLAAPGVKPSSVAEAVYGQKQRMATASRASKAKTEDLALDIIEQQRSHKKNIWTPLEEQHIRGGLSALEKEVMNHGLAMTISKASLGTIPHWVIKKGLDLLGDSDAPVPGIMGRLQTLSDVVRTGKPYPTPPAAQPGAYAPAVQARHQKKL